MFYKSMFYKRILYILQLHVLQVYVLQAGPVRFTSPCFTSLRSRRYSRAQGGKLEIPPAQKLSILSSPAAG